MSSPLHITPVISVAVRSESFPESTRAMNDAKVRIFVSSPADVEHERTIVKDIIGRLTQEFLPYFSVEPILWEEEALTADRTFQAGLVHPSDCDIVLVVLWTRLGSPLPQEPYQGMTGTEWEFFDAVSGNAGRHRPEVLVYKKTNAKLVDITNPQSTLAAIEDRKRLEEFFRRNFFNEDQTFRRAFRTFDSDAAFRNLLEAQLRKLLNRRIFVEKRGAGRAFEWHGSPFRADRTFEFGDERIFTGRESETRDLLHCLQQQMNVGRGIVLISGPSGCGKSSLVRAGLVPRLVRPHQIEGVAACRWCLVDPGRGESPLAALSSALCAPGVLGDALAEFGVEPALLGRGLETGPELAVGQVCAALKGVTNAIREDTGEPNASARLLVVVDPLERVFTAAGTGPFLAALTALAESGVVWVVAVLRSDQLCNLQAVGRPPSLAAADPLAWIRLEVPERGRIRQVIEIPALVAGLAYESDGGHNLVEQLESEAARIRLWPPLLQGTLENLFRARQVGGDVDAIGGTVGLLTAAAFREGGGLAGEALRRADDVWTRLDEGARDALPRLCRSLISLEPTAGARPAPRSGDLDGLEADAACRRLIDAMIEARLVVAEGVHDPVSLGPCSHLDGIRGGLLGRFTRRVRGDWRLRLRGDERRAAVPRPSAVESSESAYRSPPPTTPGTETGRGPLADGADQEAERDAAPDWSSYRRVATFSDRILMERWAPMRDWLRRPENRAALRLRYQITRQAQLWKRTDCNREHLLGEAGYAAALRFSAEYDDELEPVEAELLRNSRRDLRLKRSRVRLVRIVGLVLAGLLVIATVAAFWAQDASQTATVNLQRSRLYAADLAIARGNTPRAIVLALDAGGYLPRQALQTLSRAFTANRMIALLHEGAPNPELPLSAAINEDGTRAATLDPVVGMRQWRLEGLHYVPDGPPQIGEQRFHSVYFAGGSGAGAFFAASPDGVWRFPFAPDSTPQFGCGTEAGSVFETSPDGRLMAMTHALSPDNYAVCLMDLTQPGSPVLDIPLHRAKISSLDFSADGGRLVTASEDGTAKVVDSGSGEVLLRLPAGGPKRRRPIHSAVFGAGVERIATASTDNGIWIHGADGRPLERLAEVEMRSVSRAIHDSDVRDLAVSPDGRFLIAGDEDGQVVRWDLQEPGRAMVLGHHEESVVEVRVSPDGRRALTASLDNTARLWDVDSGGQLAVFSHDGAVSSARFKDGGRRVFTLSQQDGTARLWSTAPVSQLARPLPHGDHVRHLAFGPETSDGGLRLATAGDDGIVSVWTLHRSNGALRPGEPLRLQGHTRPVRRVAFSPGGGRLLSAGTDGTARIWAIERGAGREVCRLEVDARGKPARVHRALFAPSPASRWVLTASDADPVAVALWDPDTCERLDSGAGFASVSAPVQAADAAETVAGTLVATGSDDGRVRVMRERADGAWDLLCDHAMHTLPVRDVAISPDGALVASGSSDRWARVLTVEGCGTPGASVEDLVGHAGGVRSVRFSPDGGNLVTASTDGTARFWMRDGQLVQVLRGHRNEVYHADFSPDGLWILTASRDGTVGIWRRPPVDAPPLGSPYLILSAQLGGVPYAEFSRGGRYVGAAYWRDAAQVWRLWADDDGLDNDSARALEAVWGEEEADLVLVRAAHRFRRENRLDELRVQTSGGE